MSEKGTEFATRPKLNILIVELMQNKVNSSTINCVTPSAAASVLLLLHQSSKESSSQPMCLLTIHLDTLRHSALVLIVYTLKQRQTTSSTLPQSLKSSLSCCCPCQIRDCNKECSCTHQIRLAFADC